LGKADDRFDSVAPFAKLSLSVLADARGDLIALVEFPLSAIIGVPDAEQLAGQLDDNRIVVRRM